MKIPTGRRGGRRPLRAAVAALAALVAFSLVPAAMADGDEEMTADHSIVEITVANRAAVDQLIGLDVDLVEYLRQEDDGRVTVNAVVTGEEIAELQSLGYEIGKTIENIDTYHARVAERNAALAAEERSHEAAESGEAQVSREAQAAGLRSTAFASRSFAAFSAPHELTVNRVDYFQNYAGWFLSVEVFDNLVNGTGTTGPTVSFSWRTENGSYGSATTIPRFVDTDPTPDVYMYNRILVRIGPASPPYGSGTAPTPPAMIRVATSTPGVQPVEAPVRTWAGNPLPAGNVNFATQYFTKYMDPTEIAAKFESLATEFGGAGGLAQLITLPHQTNGYSRRAMCMMSGTTACTGTPGTAAAALYIESDNLGHEGGNQIRVQFRNPAVPSSPLAVNVITPNVLGGSDIVVDLATSSTGALASTAAQVRDAINGNAAAAALVDAHTYAGNAGGSVVPARALVALSDFLNAPSSVQRGPFTVKALRISKDAGKAPADSKKTGVYLFCQQHAREWVTPITCVQTAELLLRNYATDARTKELVDNLDIFILPSVNPDGSHYSLYDFASQRRNLTRYCPLTATSGMPANRNAWGVDLNRNSQSYSLFDGYFGASTSCTSDTFAGPSEESEPETKNLNYIVDTFPNIKFANNIHTYGGYFMWAPGSYTGSGRVSAPPPNHGIEAYFFKAADTVLQRIKDVRGTAVLPSRTGPIADVLYSAAGNGADDMWYRKGIIAYSFEAGSDRFSSTSTGTTQSAVGFQPAFASEGRFEATEFAAGNFGLLESALEYEYDNTAPVVEMTGPKFTQGNPISTTFKWVNEPSVVYYTVDGSTPTLASPQWERQRMRGPGQEFTFTETTTVKWFAVDVKGNRSAVQTQKFTIDANAPTIDLRLPEDGKQYLLNSVHEVDFSCDDDDAGIDSCVGTQADGANLNTATVGTKAFTVNAADRSGNTASVTHNYIVAWPFKGFNPPFGRVNEMQAGMAFPIKFSLGGNRGLNILASAPTSVQISCDAAGTPVAGTEETASISPLTYTKSSDSYQFDFKTKKAWVGSCRQLIVKLADDTQQTARFLFR